MLQETELVRLEQALRTWLDRHPAPDAPAIQVSYFFLTESGGAFTPRDLVNAIIERTELGERMLDIFEFSIRRSSLETVARDLEYFDTEPPPTASAGSPLDA